MFHIGFMKTVVIIMLFIGFNCLKILTDEEDHKFWQALKIRNSKNRLRKILDPAQRELCVKVMERLMFLIKIVNKLKRRDGCGAQQPNLTIEGMKMILEQEIHLRRENKEEEKLANFHPNSTSTQLLFI
ncbi:hypothetical protein CUMW_152020 [Citrus unshiu]|nr:hypothetical protein CUMW_152020 [Citrus unshiu]